MTSIRVARPADADAVAEVHRLAFGSPTHAGLPAAVAASPQARPAWSWVAVRDGAVVGHAMASTTYLDLDGGGTARVAHLSPLGVLPAHQSTGLGRALVEAVVAAVDADGEPFLLLEGAPAFYARLGFDDARDHGVRFDLPSFAPADAGRLRPLRAYRRLPGAVRYPEAFLAAVAG